MEKSVILSEIAFEKIKQAILTGQFQPGDKLNIELLKRQYHIGLTPIREALNRLISIGFAEFVGMKGFRVTPLSMEDLEDIYKLRQLVEGHALKEAIEQGNDSWEAELVSSYHRLAKLERNKNIAQKTDLSEWMRRYSDFHSKLLDGCHSPWLMRLDKILFEQSERYRYMRLATAKNFKKTIHDKAEIHQKLIQHVLKRDKEKAIKLHIRQLITTVADLKKTW